MKPRRSSRLPALVIGCGVVALPLPALGGEWDFTPRLSVQETYTDNVLLVEDGAEGDFVSSVTPGFSVRGIGPRLSSSIDYNLQQLWYGDKTDLDATNHQLQAVNEATVVPQWLFLDVSSRRSQQSIDNRGQVARNNRGDDGNRREVTSYEVAPRLEHRFGSWVNALLRYSMQSVDQSAVRGDNPLLDSGSSDETAYLFDISSGSRFSRMPLRLSFDSREVEFDSGRTNKLERLTGEASYVFNRKFRATVTGGDESNQFTSTQGPTSGMFWSLGGTWTPTPRTQVNGNWGDRFYGKTYNVAATHRHRRWGIGINYSEDVLTSNQFERDLLLVPLLDPTGLPVFDPVTSSQILVPIDSPTLTDDVFIQRQISVNVDYAMRRSDWAWNFFQFDRESQGSGDSELTRGMTVNVNHQIRPRLSVSVGASWRQNEFSADDSSGSFASVYPGLSYTLGPHTTARLQYELSYNDGPSSFGGGFGGGGVGGPTGGGFGGGFGGGLGSGVDNGARTYIENAVSAGLVFHL